MDIASLTQGLSTPAQSQAKQRGFEALGSADFFKLIITDLLNQDPLEPMDNDKLLQQLSSIREMELNNQITTSLQALTEQQRAGAATGLIGMLVSGGRSTDGQPVSGVVTGVRFDAAGAALLQLGPAAALPLAEVRDVTSLDQIREALMDKIVTAQRLVNNQPQEFRGKVIDLTVKGGQVYLELDSGEQVAHTAVTRVAPG